MHLADIVRSTFRTGMFAGVAAYDRLLPGPARLGPALHAPATADPVVLVGGFGTDARFLDVWRRSLEADRVRVFVYDDQQHGLGPVLDAARGLGSFADQVRARTGAAKLDVVTYSSGGTVARAWLSLQGGAALVDRLVTIDGSWRGDDDSKTLARIKSIPLVGSALHDGLPPAYFDLQRTSDVFTQLARVSALPVGVRIASIYPASAAAADAIAGAQNLQLTTEPGHIAIMRSADEAYIVARSLLLA